MPCVLLAILVLAFAFLLSQQLHAEQEPMDLNAASIEQLMKLPGIGKKRANDIARFRTQHGFKRIADLLRIRGIGYKTYRKIKPLVAVKPKAQPVENGVSHKKPK